MLSENGPVQGKVPLFVQLWRFVTEPRLNQNKERVGTLWQSTAKCARATPERNLEETNPARPIL